MPKPQFSCWPYKLKQHISRIAKKGKDTTHINRLCGILESCATELDELNNQAHTALLVRYPKIPIRYFAASLGLSYNVGRKHYRVWFKNRKLQIPRLGRTSEKTRKEWEQVVIQEIFKK